MINFDHQPNIPYVMDACETKLNGPGICQVELILIKWTLDVPGWTFRESEPQNDQCPSTEDTGRENSWWHDALCACVGPVVGTNHNVVVLFWSVIIIVYTVVGIPDPAPKWKIKTQEKRAPGREKLWAELRFTGCSSSSFVNGLFSPFGRALLC